MPKYADPAVFPPALPAADDAVMARTNGGADKSFILGNLAGLAPLAIVNDQAPFFSGGAWGAYSLTAAGRALSGVAGTANTFPYFSAANVVTLASVGVTGLASLAAANQAAGRTAIGAADDAAVVHKTGAETIEGLKTWNALARWNVGAAAGSVEYGTPNGSPGIVMKSGNPYNSDGDASMWRHDFRAFQGVYSFRVNSAAGNTIPPNGVNIASTSFYPTPDNGLNLGLASARFTTVYATNATINTSDARLKTDPRQLRDAEFKAASAIARLPAVWRWLSRVHGDENCEPEGREARKHFGPTVQAAIAVMEANGLDPFAYSFICYDEWEALPEQWHEWPVQEAVLDDDGNEIQPAVEAGRELVQEAREAGDRYSFRKEELLCFIVRALAQEIDGLSARVAALEAGRNP